MKHYLMSKNKTKKPAQTIFFVVISPKKKSQ